MPESETKNSFNLMCDLYAVDILLENKGWYLENDYMDGSKTKALRRLKQKLYQEVRPRANTLVEAFGIPEELLGDIALCKRLRQQSQPGVLPVRAVTSSRKWEQQGIIKTVVLMWRIRLAYFMGVDPARLAKVYYG